MTLITALLVLILSDRCSGCADGCVRCAGISQNCLECRNGYWIHNGMCAPCPDNCAHCSDDTRCSKCKTNFWGTDTCDKQCPESCDQSGCEDETGRCHRCQPGFYGTSCVQNCTFCKDGLCDFSDGQCTKGCIDGYFEDTASAVKKCLKCSDNCKLCQSYGFCSECDNGFYKLSYESSPGNPVTLCYHCLPDCELCVTGNNCTVCKSGSYGQLCQYNCSESYCHRCYKTDTVDKCIECIAGYTLQGSACVPEITCSQNCADGCDKNLLCLDGCKDGWSGRTCTKPCATKCQKCDQNDNKICTKCKESFFTSSCNDHCNVHCSQVSLNETCRLHDGFCVSGCTDGYWGDTCNKTCSEGCSSTQCNQTNGFCAACHRNYYGIACEQTCSESCVDDGSKLQICRKSDGRCELGCNNGYSGDRCDQIMSQEMTTFPTSVTQGTCPQCSKQDTNGNETTFYLLGIVTGVGITLMVAVGIGLFVYLRRQQKLTSERNNDIESSEQREYENTSVGMTVMPSMETSHIQPPSEVSLNVYERLQNDKADDQQQYSELGRPKVLG